MSAVWPGSPGEALPVPMAVLLVWFGHRTHWKLGGGAAKLEGPRHYLTCFELQTPKKVTPAMTWTAPGGTPGWLNKVCQPGTVWEYWLHWLAPAQCPCNAKLGLPFLSEPSTHSCLGAVAGCVVSDQLEGARGLCFLDKGMAVGITLSLLAASAESLRLVGELGLSPPV